MSEAITLLKELTKCHHADCEAVGLYHFSDEDGEEYLCKKHKRYHFYAYGGDFPDDLRERVEIYIKTNVIEDQEAK